SYQTIAFFARTQQSLSLICKSRLWSLLRQGIPLFIFCPCWLTRILTDDTVISHSYLYSVPNSSIYSGKRERAGLMQIFCERGNSSSCSNAKEDWLESRG
ncbi:hypothetical protein AMTR_s00142p00071570, partial [Amborella trichopoda]